MDFAILNINKPYGCTSHDVISKLRKILKIKKIGHSGTLDPAATGVLPIFVGKATRLIQYTYSDKQYLAEITLGKTTSTYDAKGDVVSENPCNVSKEQVVKSLESFKGQISQQVPLTSAVHYKGKKLYEYAHKGIEIEERLTRTVNVYDIELLDFFDEEEIILTVKIDCSSGTYIRCIAHDLGQQLGCGAYLSSLIRTKACNIGIEDSLTIEELENAALSNTVESFIVPFKDVVNLKILELSDYQAVEVGFGRYFALESNKFNDSENVLLLDNNAKLIGVGTYSLNESIIRPVVVFN